MPSGAAFWTWRALYAWPPSSASIASFRVSIGLRPTTRYVAGFMSM